MLACNMNTSNFSLLPFYFRQQLFRTLKPFNQCKNNISDLINNNFVLFIHEFL